MDSINSVGQNNIYLNNIFSSGQDYTIPPSGTYSLEENMEVTLRKEKKKT